MWFYSIYFCSLQQQLTLKLVLYHAHSPFLIIPGFEKKRSPSFHVWLCPSEGFIQTKLENRNRLYLSLLLLWKKHSIFIDLVMFIKYEMP